MRFAESNKTKSLTVSIVAIIFLIAVVLLIVILADPPISSNTSNTTISRHESIVEYPATTMSFDSEMHSVDEAQSSSGRYIPLIVSKTDFAWENVVTGFETAAQQAGLHYDVLLCSSDADFAVNQRIIDDCLSQNPSAVCIAGTLDENLVSYISQQTGNHTPIIRLAVGSGEISDRMTFSSSSINNNSAGAMAAYKIFYSSKIKKQLNNQEPFTVALLLSDDISSPIRDRVAGFIDEVGQILKENGDVPFSVEGTAAFSVKQSNPLIKIKIYVSSDGSPAGLEQSACQMLDDPELSAVFCTDGYAADALLSITDSGQEISPDGKHSGLVICGFDFSEAQKSAIKNKLFIGSVVQDYFMIGYNAWTLAYRASLTHKLSFSHVTAKWYTSKNLSDIDIQTIFY